MPGLDPGIHAEVVLAERQVKSKRHAIVSSYA